MTCSLTEFYRQDSSSSPTSVPIIDNRDVQNQQSHVVPVDTKLNQLYSYPSNNNSGMSQVKNVRGPHENYEIVANNNDAMGTSSSYHSGFVSEPPGHSKSNPFATNRHVKSRGAAIHVCHAKQRQRNQCSRFIENYQSEEC